MNLAPHVLLCGETGSGKSTLLRTVICNLILTTKKNLKLHLIDLKNFNEFNIFRRCSNIVKSIGKNNQEAYQVLSNISKEVDRRCELFFENDCKDILEYNKKFSKNKLDYEIVIIDEYADLQSDKPTVEIVNLLVRKARSVGVHILICTQRPSHTVITGDIRANVPSIIGMKVMNSLNSRVVLEQDGLESLRGNGHCLVKHNGKLTEVQSMFLDTDRARELLKEHYVDERKKSKKHTKNNISVFNRKNNNLKDDTNRPKKDNGEISDDDFLELLGGTK